MIYPKIPPTGTMRALNWHMQYIAERMRPDEIEHWLAMSGSDEYSPEVAAAGFIATAGTKFSLVDTAGMPIVVGGFVPVSAGCFEIWLAGTMDGWEHHWRAITKCGRAFIRAAFADGARRIFVSTIASRTDAQGWYESGLGLVFEGTHRSAGAQGQDIVFYSRTIEDLAL